VSTASDISAVAVSIVTTPTVYLNQSTPSIIDSKTPNHSNPPITTFHLNEVNEIRIRRRRGMEQMIIIGSRISAACGQLIANPKGDSFRRVRKKMFGT